MKNAPSISANSKGFWRHTRSYELKGGVRRQKSFSLGSNRAAAEDKAATIEYFWALEKTKDDNGKKVWSEATLAEVTTRIGTIGAKVEPPKYSSAPATQAPPPLVIPTAEDGILLSEAIARYNTFVGKQVTRGVCSTKTQSHIVGRLESVMAHIEDRPLHSIDFATLQGIRAKLTGGPNGENRLRRRIVRCKNKHGEVTTVHDRGPIALITIKGWLMALGQAFKYFQKPPIFWKCDDSDWRSLLCLTKREIRNLESPADRAKKVERLSDGRPAKMYTLDELKFIYHIALPYERMLILFGMTMGWTQKDISTFEHQMLYTENGETFIDRSRSKTGQPGHWWVCPELAILIHRYQTDATKCPLVFLTDDGFPLLHNRTDNVKMRWAQLMRRANKGKEGENRVRTMKWSSMRKLAGQLILNFTGDLGLAKTMMAHVGQSVAEQHYVGLGNEIGLGITPSNRLHTVQKQIHAALKEMFNPAPLRPTPTLTVPRSQNTVPVKSSAAKPTAA